MSHHDCLQATQSGAIALASDAWKNTAAVARAHWRWFGVGLSTGCLVALLNVGVGKSLAERRPSTAPTLVATAALPSQMNATLPWTPDQWFSSSPAPAAEIELDEIVIRATPITWRSPEKPNPQIELETRDVMVSGRAVAAVILLKRTGSTSGRARVLCKTVPGTATPAKDYESLSTIVQFGDKQAVQTLFVPILQQPPDGESRTFSVRLERAPRGPSLGTVTSTTVTILR